MVNYTAYRLYHVWVPTLKGYRNAFCMLFWYLKLGNQKVWTSKNVGYLIKIPIKTDFSYKNENKI